MRHYGTFNDYLLLLKESFLRTFGHIAVPKYLGIVKLMI